MQLYQDYHLASANTLSLPSVAKQLVCLDHVDQLPELQPLMEAAARRWVLGGGSNMVLANYIDALVIKVQTKGIRIISETTDQVLIEAQAGENWHGFVQYCLAQGWLGLENLALIPGTVGAAPVQNIGAYGIEVDQLIEQVQVWDVAQAKMCVFNSAACQFSYRDSVFKRSLPGRYLITAVQFRLQKKSTWQPVMRYPDLSSHPDLQGEPTALAIFNAVVQIRQRKLPAPAVLPNAGSFFKNPIVSARQYQVLLQNYPTLVAYPYGEDQYKLAAGWLIEQAGWKGKQLGPVGMHKNQALVLVNYGGATSTEVRALVEMLKRDIKQKFDVLLEQEPIAVQ